MRAKDKRRLGVLRLVSAAIKQQEIDTRTALSDGELLVVLEKMLKQRRDSREQFEKGGRPDLANQEAFEIEVIKTYMPTPFSAAEIDALLDQAIAEANAGSLKEMGKVMSLLKPRLQGRADMGAVSAKVRERIAKID
uniref:Glutamyl-tRNA amidotransferase n=1 Tax=Candidatus Kentrum sp. SD TaxID=2126332 RepID=A0A450Y6L2_9GAMM|nr:MAG: hypothetical protein BECKSD772F_GA0070984_101126 [Candidatus Kentron sp. SD]VFK39712.1 MAG: hypothetical protein BECKSD772E_GA0070983_100414 [Candidatus Kentron sp. SD]VFK79218.1 MAG: hypothetical protein BECKSD772D_GA0070982_104017 [Candidatus Kentron sp. SD]